MSTENEDGVRALTPEEAAPIEDTVELMIHETLSDEMKAYEVPFASIKIPVGKPWIARLDGRGFSKFTKSMRKPFDENFSVAMNAAAEALLEEFHAALVYTQSDEISIAFYPQDEIPFDGKLQKICSIMASIASSAFNATLSKSMDVKKLASFDCRIMVFDDMGTVARNLMWRQHDAKRNSISMAAHFWFGHKATLNKGTATKLQMLETACPWETYDVRFRTGIFLKKVLVETTLDAEQLEKIPEKHRPTGPVTRSKIEYFDPGHLRGYDCLQKLFDKE